MKDLPFKSSHTGSSLDDPCLCRVFQPYFIPWDIWRQFWYEFFRVLLSRIFSLCYVVSWALLSANKRRCCDLYYQLRWRLFRSNLCWPSFKKFRVAIFQFFLFYVFCFLFLESWSLMVGGRFSVSIAVDTCRRKPLCLRKSKLFRFQQMNCYLNYRLK